MKLNTKRMLASSVALSLLALFNNCSMDSFHEEKEVASVTLFSGGNDEIIPIPNTKTASVVSSNRVLDSMVSCLGTGVPSAAAKAEFTKNAGSFSVEGRANSITAPMLSAGYIVGAEVCNDLVNQERAKVASERRFFSGVDFNRGHSQVSDVALGEAVRKISRSCWGRNETPEELSLILGSTREAFQASADTTANTRTKLVYFCSAMISSFSFLEM